MSVWLFLIAALFGCGHEARTRVFHDSEGFYQRCLDCGKRLPYTKVNFTRSA